MDTATVSEHADIFDTTRDALARTLLGLSTAHPLDSTQASHRLAIHHAETAIKWTSQQNAAAAAEQLADEGETPTMTVYDSDDSEESLYSHIHDGLLDFFESQTDPVAGYVDQLPAITGNVLTTLVGRRIPEPDTMTPVGGLTPTAVRRIFSKAA